MNAMPASRRAMLRQSAAGPGLLALRSFSQKGVACIPIHEERWGTLTSITLPGGAYIGLYQPKHPTAHPPQQSQVAYPP